MAKTFKCCSHAERLNNPKFKVKCVSDLVESFNVNVTENTLVNDRVVPVSKVKKINPIEVMNKFKVSDFSIENLQASGAIANLKEVQLNGYTMDSIDSTVSKLDALDKNINISENK